MLAGKDRSIVGNGYGGHVRLTMLHIVTVVVGLSSPTVRENAYIKEHLVPDLCAVVCCRDDNGGRSGGRKGQKSRTDLRVH